MNVVRLIQFKSQRRICNGIYHGTLIVELGIKNPITLNTKTRRTGGKLV